MPRSILIVEDDKNIADLIRLYLEKEGMVCHVAGDGLEGLEKFHAVQPDLVMLDIKHIDPEKHRELTLQPNENILKFAAYLNEKQVDMWIRHVVVPGITDDEKYLFDLGYFIGQFSNLKALDVLPYHTMGEKKHESLGMEYRLKGVPPMDKDKLIDKKKFIIDGIKQRRKELSSK